MRLINTHTWALEEFYARVPRYAILSHTWGEGEVSFRDMRSPERQRMKGFAKILQTCKLARADKIDYAWVDTCCIDKSSSAELTEAINSMFQWYMHAAKCYVFMEDLQRLDENAILPQCRWFTRGWTLQELLAPKVLEIFNMHWEFVGTKADYARAISVATEIPEAVIVGEAALGNCSVAAKMSWAARRETTRVEDMAYCLLGIFDVNMPMLYGEGWKAFRRLQEEVIKRSNDLTIFAWSSSAGQEQSSLPLLAESPAAFAGSSSICPFSDDFEDFSVTNKGLLISGDAPLRVVAPVAGGPERSTERYVLHLGSDEATGADGGVYLRKIGPKIYCRDGGSPLAGFGRNKYVVRHLLDATDYYILIDPLTATTISRLTFRSRAIHVPTTGMFRLTVQAPELLWDRTDRVFLRPKAYKGTHTRSVLFLGFKGNLSVGRAVRFYVFCDYRGASPSCKMLLWDEDDSHPSNSSSPSSHVPFADKYRMETAHWTDIATQIPELERAGSSIDVKVGSQVYRIASSFRKGVVESLSKEVELFILEFNVERRPYNSKIDVRVKSL